MSEDLPVIPLAQQQVDEAIKYNDDEIVHKTLRESINQYADTDMIFRIAEDRARRMGSADQTIERAKLITAWIDGFTIAARAYRPHQ